MPGLSATSPASLSTSSPSNDPPVAGSALDQNYRQNVACEAWEQAAHGGDLTPAVEAGLIDRSVVTQLGDVLAGTAAGRQLADDITIFDSTGLAIQDLAIALAAMERADELDLQAIDLQPW